MSVRLTTIGSNLAAWTFLAAIAVAPLLFGGHIPLAWGLNAALLGGALLLFCADRLLTGQPFPLPQSWFALPMAAFALVAVWAFIQSAGWTPAALHHAGWDAAGAALDRPSAGAISVNPSETRLALLRLTTAGAAAWLALQIGRDPRWARRIVIAVAGPAALYALYAIAAVVLGWNKVLWIPKHNFGGEVATGTFINPNHFATYAGLGLLAGLGLFIRSLRLGLDDYGLAGGRAFAARLYFLARSAGIYSLLLIPLSVALVMSASRAGFLLTGIAAVALLIIEQMRRKTGAPSFGVSGKRLVLVAAAVAAAAVIVLAGFGDQLGKDLTKINDGSLQSRIAVLGISLRALLDAPFTGFGYGTFADVFPLYRDTSVSLLYRWREAHNTYVEALVELGIPAALLLFFAVGSMVYRCFRGALLRRRDHLAPLVAACATVLIGLHALVDFSIQLQGITITYAALLGAGCAQSWSSRKACSGAGPKATPAHKPVAQAWTKGIRQ